MTRRSSFCWATGILALTLFLAGLVFAQAGGDVARRTVAMTYLKDPVKVDLTGTTLRPNAHGEATVERWRKRNESEIDIKVENLIPAFNYGGDYTTYVLWAITPEGQVSNLGEFRLSGGTAHLHAATPYQTFAMIVTAEPHYLVKLPSRKVVLENLAPDSKHVQIQSSEIYFNGDSGKFYTDNDIPATAERDYNKTPMELLEARRAVRIATLAEGERYDTADMKSAEGSLRDAEAAFRRGANVNEVGRIARDAISYAVRTRDISEDRAAAAARRAEIERRDEEVSRATSNASDLQQKLTDTEARLRASEAERTNTEEQLNRAMRDAAEAKAEVRSLQSEKEQLQAENEKLNKQLAEARGQVGDYETKLASANSKAEAAERAEHERREADARRNEYASVQSELARVLTVKPNEIGFAATLPDSYFVANRTDLALRVKSKMDTLAQILSTHPNVTFMIEGFSDTRPGAEEFALGRAQAVGDYIAAVGVAKNNFKVESRGDADPISRAKTLKARAENRRVELVFASPHEAP
jgi:outer membrane protein OmpA-like peptidoglycan-associated protein